MQFTLTGGAGERRRFVEEFETFCRCNRLPDEARHAADLALEEHLTNILSHGFAAGTRPHATVKLTTADGCLHIEIADSGKPFNPLEAAQPDTSLALEEKPIGGLGVHLMRQSMDELTYARESGRNVLRMKKRLDAG